MKPLLSLLILVFAATAVAQSQNPANPAGAASAKRNPPAKAGTVRPDPNLLDGSKLEAEKRPLFGMLSEIEMGENEGGKPDKVSPNSGPAGGSEQGPPPPGGSAGAPPPPGGGSEEKVAEGPAAEAQGAQAKSLQNAAGAQAGGGPAKPQNVQIGDASLQIKTAAASPDVVGTQPTTTQQYEKKLPSGPQSNNRNQGAEKGKVIPKGL